MSIRSNGSGDHLALTGSFGITTGQFSFGIWTKVVNTRASTFVDFLGLGSEEVDAVSYISIGSDNAAAPKFNTYDNITGVGTHDPLLAATAGSWFWVTVVRNSTDVISAMFDDSASTTPLSTFSHVLGSGSAGALDWLVVGELFAAEWPDAEFANAKLHAGVGWTNAQSRAESQHTATQLGGGDWKVVCPLTSTSVLTNFGTLGGSITNTGCVNGASSPGQLTDDVGGGGGGSGFVPDEDYMIFVPPRLSY